MEYFTQNIGEILLPLYICTSPFSQENQIKCSITSGKKWATSVNSIAIKKKKKKPTSEVNWIAMNKEKGNTGYMMIFATPAKVCWSFLSNLEKGWNFFLGKVFLIWKAEVTSIKMDTWKSMLQKMKNPLSLPIFFWLIRMESSRKCN